MINHSPIGKKTFLNKSIPLLYIVLILAVTITVIWWQYFELKAKLAENAGKVHNATNTGVVMQQVRSSIFPHVNRIRLVDLPTESQNLKSLKNDLEILVKQKVELGEIKSASIYLRRLNNGEWISINGSMGFNPGSLMKIPVLITILKQEEANPGFLKKEILFDKPKAKVPTQTFSKEVISSGKRYTIESLLYNMIVKSDNNATYVLSANMDIGIFQKLFTDLQLVAPDKKTAAYLISSTDFTKFLRVLYSATYLSEESSEYALNLLSQCEFREGLLKEIPKNITVAHKFGEQANPDSRELHETGIFYLNDNTYVVTIMTTGSKLEVLPGIISDFSKTIFQYFNH